VANHKGESECVTCRFHADTASGIFCNKYSTDIPVERGPYLICRLWQRENGQTLDEHWKNKYLPLEDTLYKHDPYWSSPPTVIRKLKP
jgi:hypothetical protein